MVGRKISTEKREARSEKREARSEKREARRSWKVDVKASTFFLDFRRKPLTKNSLSIYNVHLSKGVVRSRSAAF
ncbi:hypothetical protein L1D24_17235 [Vibrio brasiliensis]|uniref:hypothetical protein n=1 Tax=Vibrio brasiliensis TaxID=170652 RepID=UPI001EFD1FA1|nr:hypothetical protein [Vibrio brasiliensis]MCG9650297.1 hypothetical protein [Vibrio brasiliensis]